MSNYPIQSTAQQQTGSVLLLSMIILAVMTVLGLSLHSNSTLEEKMAANQMNNHKTFHASESAVDITVQDTDTLAEALVSPTAITVVVDVGDPNIAANAQLTYMGQALPSGWSLGENDGSFAAHNINTTGTAIKTNASAKTMTSQGVARIGPRF